MIPFVLLAGKLYALSSDWWVNWNSYCGYSLLHMQDNTFIKYPYVVVLKLRPKKVFPLVEIYTGVTVCSACEMVLAFDTSKLLGLKPAVFSRERGQLPVG